MVYWAQDQRETPRRRTTNDFYLVPVSKLTNTQTNTTSSSAPPVMFGTPNFRDGSHSVAGRLKRSQSGVLVTPMTSCYHTRGWRPVVETLVRFVYQCLDHVCVIMTFVFVSDVVVVVNPFASERSMD